MEIVIDNFFVNGKHRSDSASVSFDPETWAQIVEHVSRAREMDRLGKEVVR